MKIGNSNQPSRSRDPSPSRSPTSILPAPVGDRALLHIVLETVQSVGWASCSAPAGQDRRFRPQMMLTLLAYCYSSGLYSSRDIEWATRIDPMISYICAHQFPDWLAIRRFRRQNRRWLEQCLARILERTSSQLRLQPQPQSNPQTRPETVAQEKVDLAIIMDRAESES